MASISKSGARTCCGRCQSGDRRVLACYELADRATVCELDDPSELLARDARMGAWALTIFSERAWNGIAW